MTTHDPQAITHNPRPTTPQLAQFPTFQPLRPEFLNIFVINTKLGITYTFVFNISQRTIISLQVVGGCGGNTSVSQRTSITPIIGLLVIS